MLQPAQSDGVGEMLGGLGFLLVLGAILAIILIAVIASFTVSRLTHRNR